MVEMPERKHTVAIKIGADSWDDVLAALKSIEYEFYSKGPGRNIISGGCSFSYIAVDDENPAQTHEQYFEEVDAWLAERRAKDREERGNEKWKARNIARRKQKVQDRLACDLQFFSENNNTGLLHARLAAMLDVIRVSVVTGWTCFVDVTMRDGFTILASHAFSDKALRKAAGKVVERLEDIHGLGAENEH